MFAVFESGGLQFRAEEGMQVKVPYMNVKPGDTVSLDKILLVKSDDDSFIGTPYLESVTIEAEVIDEGLADKINVYKFKRRTKYRKLTGHRQKYTELKIKKISPPAN